MWNLNTTKLVVVLVQDTDVTELPAAAVTSIATNCICSQHKDVTKRIRMYGCICV